MLCVHLRPESHARERRIVLSCTRSNSLQFLSLFAHHHLTHLLKCTHSSWWNSFCLLHYIAMLIITPDWSWVDTVSSQGCTLLQRPEASKVAALWLRTTVFSITLQDTPYTTGKQTSLSCPCIETNNCIQVEQIAGRHLHVIWSWQETNHHCLIVVHKFHCITERGCT